MKNLVKKLIEIMIKDIVQFFFAKMCREKSRRI